MPVGRCPAGRAERQKFGEAVEPACNSIRVAARQKGLVTPVMPTSIPGSGPPSDRIAAEAGLGLRASVRHPNGTYLTVTL